MLNDINKIVPKLNEKDSEEIYKNLSKRKVEQKEKKLNNKFIIAFASFVLLLLFIIPLGDMINDSNSSNHQNPEISDEIDEDEMQPNNNILLNETSVIGIAAFNEFETKEVRKLSNVFIKLNNKDSETTDLDEESNSSEDEYLKISYPYDYVKINSAYKFLVDVPDIEDTIAKDIVESNCGLGELEVVVAEFETYINENGYNCLSVQDTLICLRGYNGYYTILVNSGVYTNDSTLEVFSSHKKLTEDEVSKDFTPPILSIFLKEENDSKYVYFETSDNLLSFGSYNQDLAFKNLNEIERVSRNTLYSVLELTKLPVKEVEANVLEINLKDKIIKVQTEFKLEYVHVNENTEGEKLENISVGDVIIVEYDFLFEKYNPTNVVANSITLKNVHGGE